MTDYVAAYKWEASYSAGCDAHRLAGKLQTEATIIDGVIRWNSNNAVPFDDAVALAAHIGLPVDAAKCTQVRDTETTAFLDEYRKRPRRDSAEAQFERRAAFGRGKTIVDVISGRKYRT